MKLFFDIIINQNVAALTIDIKKIEYNLSLQGVNLEEFLESAPKGDAGASCTLSFGEYVLMFSIDRQLKEVSMVAFNYTFDLDGNFDLFADRMSPSSISEFFEVTEKIRKLVQC